MSSGPTAWRKRAFGWYPLGSFLLMAVLVVSLVAAVTGAVRGFDPLLIWPSTLGALVLGWGLTTTRLSRRWFVGLTLVIGILVVSLSVGRLWHHVGEFAVETSAYVQRLIETQTAVEATPLNDIKDPGVPGAPGSIDFEEEEELPRPIDSLVELGDGLSILRNRFLFWMRGMIINQSAYDPVVTIMIWSLAIWFSVMWASWQVRRNTRPLGGAIPAIALVAFALVETNSSVRILMPMLGSTLALMILVSHHLLEQQWQRSSVGFSKTIRKNTTWAAGLLSVGIVLTAFSVSSVSIKDILENIRESAERENGGLTDSLGLEETVESVSVNAVDRRIIGGLPTSHLVGSGPELSEQVVMEITVEEPAPISGEIRARTVIPGYYWRSITYDDYHLGGWSTPFSEQFFYEENTPAIPNFGNNQRLILQEVTMVQNRSGLVYAAGDVAAVTDADYQVAWRYLSNRAGAYDMFGVTALIGDKNSYEVRSLLPAYTEEDLRNTGQNYPDWVSSQYLDLPDTVPDRVLALAQELTATQVSVYDRAAAIERYLRTFPYTLDLPVPPNDRDLADYFLFEIQKGYCDYYASSMVVLARAAGIPTRLAVGYIGGEYDEDDEVWVVTEDQAHSWVEVYFPGYGWVNFEPTAGRPEIDRQEDTEEDQAALYNLPTIRLDELNVPINIAELIFLVVRNAVLGLVLIMILWPQVDRVILNWQTVDKVIAKMYRRMMRFGRWIEAPTRPSDTPHEFAQAMETRLQRLYSTSAFRDFLVSAPRSVTWLSEQVIRSAYSLDPPGADEKKRAIQIWIRLQRQLLLAVVLSRVERRKQTRAVTV